VGNTNKDWRAPDYLEVQGQQAIAHILRETWAIQDTPTKTQAGVTHALAQLDRTWSQMAICRYRAAGGIESPKVSPHLGKVPREFIIDFLAVYTRPLTLERGLYRVAKGVVIKPVAYELADFGRLAWGDLTINKAPDIGDLLEGISARSGSKLATAIDLARTKGLLLLDLVEGTGIDRLALFNSTAKRVLNIVAANAAVVEHDLARLKPIKAAKTESKGALAETKLGNFAILALEQTGVSLDDFAKRCGLSEDKLQSILFTKDPIAPPMLQKLVDGLLAIGSGAVTFESLKSVEPTRLAKSKPRSKN
jgi:hypothetical protein